MVRFVRRKSFFITRQKRLQHRDKASAEGFLAMSLMNFWFLQLVHPKNPSTICPWKKENYFAYRVWFKWKMSMGDPPRPYRLCVREWICIQMWIAQHISHRSHPFSPSLPQALKIIWQIKLNNHLLQNYDYFSDRNPLISLRLKIMRNKTKRLC